VSQSESVPEKKSAAEAPGFTISMDQVRDFQFRVRFDKEQFAELWMDEPPPLGGDKAPNASRILAAAVGNCLSASLLFCARKSRSNLSAIHTDVSVELARNEKGRMRIGKIRVQIDPKSGGEDQSKMDRCLELFEDFCVVTQSVRQGIDVEVEVKNSR
jgi:organic hydroperoxide reductase OsmC/OhrA